MGGHRGTGGGVGQEQGWIVAEMKSQLANVMYPGPCPVTGGRGGVCMYVCMYVHTVVDGMACMCSIYLYYPASLTMSLAVMSAPCRRRSEQAAVWPQRAVQWRAVLPPYNNRETERQRERDRSDQRHTGEKHRHTDRGGQQGRAG
jgi:hypothetical protein